MSFYAIYIVYQYIYVFISSYILGLFGLYHFHHGLGNLFDKFCANKPRNYKNGGFIQYPQFKSLLQLVKILVDYKPIITKKVNLQIQQQNSEKNNNAKIDISKRSNTGIYLYLYICIYTYI